MAKGQKRSTREVRKPKQPKKDPAETKSTPASQVKRTTANDMPRGKFNPR